MSGRVKGPLACLCGTDALFVESDFLTDDYHLECGHCGRKGQHGITEHEAWERWNAAIAKAMNGDGGGK